MNNNFTRTSPSNPCQFCDDIKGNCRHGDDIHLCMGLNSNRKFEIHNQHKIIGFTDDGLWAMLKLDNSQKWGENQRIKPAKQALKKPDKSNNSLPIDARNTGYRRILAKLDLSLNHTIQSKRKARAIFPRNRFRLSAWVDSQLAAGN